MIKLGCNDSLPPGWEWVKAQDCMDVRDGTHDSPKAQDTGVPLVTSKNLVNGEIDFTTCSYISNDDHDAISKRSKVDRGDILYAMIGTIGNPVIVDAGFEFSIKNVALFKFPDKSISNRYIYHYLNSSIADQQLSMNSRGGTQKFVSLGNIRSLDIPLPPLAEQQRIAAILDKADAIRRKRQQANQLADDFLRAVFLDMFGDPVTNPKDWEVKPLGECLKFLTSGSRGWAKYYSETGSKFIRIQNVSKNKLLIDDMAFVTAPDGAEATRTKVRLDDVLLSITADLGRSSVVTDEIVGGHINQHLALLRLDTETLNPRYLSAYLSSDAGVRQFERKNKSAVKAGLNFTDIKTLEIMVPPIEKQAEYQKLYEKLTSNETKRIDSDLLLTTVFDALSQKAFRGEL